MNIYIYEFFAYFFYIFYKEMISFTPRYVPLSQVSRSKSEKKIKKPSFTPTPAGIRNQVKSPPLKITYYKESINSPGIISSPRPDMLLARFEFFDSFKNLPKYTEKNSFEKIESSPNLAYLEDVHKQYLIPKPIGLIRNQEPENSIDLHCYSMGDSYAHAFSESLKHFKTLESLNLRANRLSEKGAYQILSNLEFHPVRYLSLSDNILGERSLECILSILRSPKPYLKHLNLDNTRLSTNAITLLASVLSTNQSVVNLSLAKNNLNTSSAKALRDMLHYNEKLKKLDLHWNCLKGEGAMMIFEGILDHPELEELDLSWNAIGNTKDLNIIQKISENLSKQGYLKHLDLSHNYITHIECEILGKGLEDNHSLLGLHIAGNECYLDPRGFVIPSAQTHLDQGHFFKRIIGTAQHTRSTRMNCWICEGWTQVTFYWKPLISGKAVSEPIFLHLECDDYKPELMEHNSEFFELTRAVPPGSLKFFFSNLTSPMKSKEYQTELLHEPFQIEVEYWENCIIPIKILIVNKIITQSNKNFENNISTTKPRIPGLKYAPIKEELIRIPWSIEISLFKDYKFMDNQLKEECFEFDWNMSKISALIKIPLQQTQIREILLENYEVIYDTYKWISAYSGSEIFSIGSNVFTDFLNECKVIDNLYGASDFGVNWNACIVPKEKDQVYNPGNALVSYEFLEILVRVANDRYVRNKICGNVIDATRKLLAEHLMEIMKKYDYKAWRFQEYLTEEVDLVYKAHKIILDFIFKRYSGRKALPGQKPFMSLEEFRELCKDAKFENEKCGLRDIDLSFALAMMVQVDEVYKKRHIEMSFVEFLEALARVCNCSDNMKKYPRNEKDEIKELYQSNPERKLHEKIEDNMPNLLKLCSQTLKENFVFPTSETYKRMMYKLITPTINPIGKNIDSKHSPKGPIKTIDLGFLNTKILRK